MPNSHPTPPQPTERGLDVLSGVLERVTFHSEESGYTVARIAVEGARDLVTAVGSFSNPIVGEQIRCEGRWTAHREFGRQFVVERYETSRPATAFAIEKYLGSGLIKGVGPVMAKRMVEKFGLNTLDTIEHSPLKLKDVEGIGAKRVEMIQRAWYEQREIRNVMLFLQEKGVSATFAVKIYKTYGDCSIETVTENPYRLAQDIWGIGFRTADKIAGQLGIEPDSERRLEAGLLYTLSEGTEFGHMYLPEPKLIQSAVKILEVDAEKLLPVLETMITGQTAIAEELPAVQMAGRAARAIYHPALYYTEVGLANQIAAHITGPALRTLSRHKLDAWLAAREAAAGVTLSREQRDAVAHALENRMMVLTGGPGTGKTLTTNTIAAAFEAQHKRILLASPTGRAAKRLSEVTGRDAQTIHRLLRYDPARRAFQHNEENRLECDVLIADEVSMLDAVLAHNLLKAIPDEAQIIFVGDSDQLPSVGAGSVLADLLECGHIPSVCLTQVFRQAQESLIVTNAHRIREGQFPVLIRPSERSGRNCIWIEVEDPPEEPEEPELNKEPRLPPAPSPAENAARRVVSLVRKTLPALGYSLEDIQVLSAMHRGTLGVAFLNELLQEALNPADRTGQAPELLRGSRRFRVGDRVIQLTNNYDKNVYNGDLGIIGAIRPDDQIIAVRFPEMTVEYDYADYDQLQLAYALSIHKSQGSEYRAVVLVIHSSQYMMLQRNLLYTGLTRARDLCLLVADVRAIGRAVKNNRTTRRFTRLPERIRELVENGGPSDRLL